ncbi:tetratricopeptide repeat protein [Chitinophaga horti]|uniref:Tetratricopeptide repeat protein n=1 Tax=Chitinophaga horti TaxID=2920382 RepID=A0ABY6J6K5_9BACT|nr:tetratricopeptide repeat protein [Chitinophaga horti]UYQ95300.1 tetratricopeptide repeat protein [Chitinophaga horti]
MSALLERAGILVQQSRYSDAIKTLHQHLYEHSTDTEALYLLALCHLQMDAHNEAEEVIENALSISPDDDRFFYLKARVLTDRKEFKKAGEMISEAVSLNPVVPHYYGVWSQILLLQRNYAGAQRKAEEGLAFDPEDQLCLNMRSHALYSLNQREDAFSGLRTALEKNPENAYTHANMGWKYLESGRHNEALDHFREALRLDPNLDWARNGMVQAIKSKYWLYRIFLKYNFFMARQSGRMQIAIILGIYALSQLANHYVWPLYIFLTILVLSTWLIGPVSNLFLRFNTYGRYLLSPKEMKISEAVGVLLGTAVVSGILYGALGLASALALCVTAAMLTLPVATMESPEKPRNRWILRGITITIGVLGLAGVLVAILSGTELSYPLMGAIILTFAYQWVANVIAMKER